MTRCIPWTLALVLCVSAWIPTSVPAQTTRPNIILIMSDDMGYSDLGCYGGEIATPNLDALARGGLRYTQFYNTGRCCPTRASLLTGLYAHQAGIGRMTNDEGQPGYRGDLSLNAVTLAEVLKSADYRTYMSGKWHVTTQLRPDGNKDNWPRQRGFDRFYGTIIGAGSFYDPWTLTRDNTAITPDNDPAYQPETFYYTHAISDNAVKFINDHKQQHDGEPFFLYMAYTSPHWPLHALEEDIAQYEGFFDEGYHHFREQRFERMKAMGLIPETTQLSEAPSRWDDVPQELRAFELRCMEVYAAMITSMDRGIGQVVDALKANGQYENTLILYLHDNGGCHEAMGRLSRNHTMPEPREPMDADELQSRMIPTHTRDGEPLGRGPDVMPGPAATYHAYGWPWANVSNTPFRWHKSRVHEGGIATPLIAHWPAGIDADGELRHRIGHLIDIMPTCVEVAGATYPETFGQNTIMPMEGKSLVTSFSQDTQEERVLIWEHFGSRAIRDGKWKLVSLPKGDWELYDMEVDRSEMNDLAASHPEKAKELAALWEHHAHRTLIYPRPDGK